MISIREPFLFQVETPPLRAGFKRIDFGTAFRIEMKNNTSMRQDEVFWSETRIECFYKYVHFSKLIIKKYPI
jgi:hypothetical protein